MANDKDQPELPRVEPEIIPPDRSASGPGRGADWRRAACPPYGQNETAGMHRVYVTRIGPFGFAMLTLVFAILAAAVFLIFAGFKGRGTLEQWAEATLKSAWEKGDPVAVCNPCLRNELSPISQEGQ